MFNHVLIAVAVAATMSGGVAVAKESAVPAADASAPAPSEKTRYCIKSERVTGTILQAPQCKTLAQWRKLGIDPTQKQR